MEVKVEILNTSFTLSGTTSYAEFTVSYSTPHSEQPSFLSFLISLQRETLEKDIYLSEEVALDVLAHIGDELAKAARTKEPSLTRDQP